MEFVIQKAQPRKYFNSPLVYQDALVIEADTIFRLAIRGILETRHVAFCAFSRRTNDGELKAMLRDDALNLSRQGADYRQARYQKYRLNYDNGSAFVEGYYSSVTNKSRLKSPASLIRMMQL